MTVTYNARSNDERSKSRLNLRPGFSFIELVIAISIIAILSIVIVPNYLRYVERAKVNRTKETLGTLKTAITSYYDDNGKYPNQLIDLIRKPADVKRWTERYIDMDEVPEDAWGHPFIYKLNSKGKTPPYELYTETDKGVKYSVWELGSK